jgi:hypothetical protein
MAINLLANPEHYRMERCELNSEDAVMDMVKEFLRSNVNATEEQFEKMFYDMEKERNHEIRLDDREGYERHGNSGTRVAYGAFKHSAFEHSVQTAWSYTFEVIDTGDELYLGADSWGWLPDVDLASRVDTHLE